MGSERLQFLAGLEAHRFAGRDADFLSGARIAANACFTRAHVEDTEAAQLDPLALAERVLHGFKDGFDSLFGLGPAHSGLVYDGINNVQLNHTTLLLFNGKLCYACSCGLSSWTRSGKMRVFARSRGRPWMSVKPDRWIRKMALEHKMIEPFEDRQVREGVISYGVSSYGYDIRVADEFRIFTNVNSTIVDPKHFDSRSLVEFKGAECLVPPNSFALGRSVEYFRIPRNVLTICLGKSTYARCGIIVNVTPFEPEWEGFVTLEISNTTPLPAKIYANEGLCQVLFFESDEECEISYKDKKGKYQAQQGIVLAAALVRIFSGNANLPRRAFANANQEIGVPRLKQYATSVYTFAAWASPVSSLARPIGNPLSAPALVAFRKRADSRDSLAAQEEREPGGGHFIRARAKQNYLAVPGNHFVGFLELRGIHVQRAGNRLRVGVEVERVAQVDNDEVLAGVYFFLQLFGSDTRNLQIAQEFLAIIEFPENIACECGEQKDEQPFPEVSRLRGNAFEVAAERVACDREGAHPEQSPERIEQQKLGANPSE